MIKTVYKFVVLTAVVIMTCVGSLAQRDGFIQTDGPNLRSKLEQAIRQGRAKQSRFWTAYAFEVRPGIAVDAEWRNDGNTTIVNGASISVGSKIETRNLGVFVLHEPTDGAIARVEVYNLDRHHEYSGYPVYWMGRATNEESLSYLKGLVEANVTGEAQKHAVVAIGLHDDPRIGGMLEDFVRSSKVDRVRSTAVFWLGQIPGHNPFLVDLVRNEQESVSVRKEAAFSIGISKEPDAMNSLESLYSGITNREVKKQIIFAASINGNDPDSGVRRSDGPGTNFLIKVAESDGDRELRKQALFWLGQKAGQRSLEVLGNVIDKSDDDKIGRAHV